MTTSTQRKRGREGWMEGMDKKGKNGEKKGGTMFKNSFSELLSIRSMITFTIDKFIR